MLFLPSAVSDALAIISKHAVKCIEIESVSYEAEEMVDIIKLMECEFIIVPNELSETKDKMTVSLESLETMLSNNYRQNVDVVTKVGGSIVHDRFVKQLSGKWLRFNRVYSNEVKISYNEFTSYRNQHELLKVVEYMNIDLDISSSKEVA